MPIQFNLEKEKQRVVFTLKKRDMPDMRASIGMTLDVSGSTKELYYNGTIQRVVEQLVPIGLQFDDNGNLDVYTFASGASIAQVQGATSNNYVGFVERDILNNKSVPKWGGTDYAPILEKLIEDYGFTGKGSEYNRSLAGDSCNKMGEKKTGFFSQLINGLHLGAAGKEHKLQPSSASGEAVINYFITDGENGDKEATYALLKAVEATQCNIYFLFIGVGSRNNFEFLDRIGADFSNVGFLNVHDLESFANSEDLYDHLLPEELTIWLKQKRKLTPRQITQ